MPRSPRPHPRPLELSLPRLRVAAGALLLLALAAQHGRAQCATHWLPGDGGDGVDGQAYAVRTWDPDGAGPAAPLVVVAGAFVHAGNQTVGGVAAWDPVALTWSSLGAGLNGAAVCLEVLASGDLAVGGNFTTAGGVACNGVARWDGLAWHALGAGVSGAIPGVFSLCALPNGDLLAAGRFATAGGVAANNVARWDGAAWHALGAGTGGEIRATGVLPNGDAVVAGSFATAGGGAALNIARWNGATWSPLGAGLTFVIDAMVVRPTGEVIAGGAGSLTLVSWNGSSWNPIWTSSNRVVRTLSLQPNGVLYIGGSLQPTHTVGVVEMWTGSTGSTIGMLGGPVTALGRAPAGDLIVGGDFRSVEQQAVQRIARLNGTQWSTMTLHANDQVLAVAPLADGGYVVGGEFTSIGVAANHVARWTGTSYAPLGAGTAGGWVAGTHGGSNVTGTVYAVAQLPNGDIVAGGDFLTAGGVNARDIARWDGSTWSPLGSGLSTVRCMLVLPNGDLLVGCASGLELWNGAAWSNVSVLSSAFGFGPAVSALTRLPNGDLVVGGSFTSAGGTPASGLALWNGVSLQGLTVAGGAQAYVQSLATRADGSVAIGGRMYEVSGAVRTIGFWSGGTTWSCSSVGPSGSAVPFGQPLVSALHTLPDGDLLVGGSFTTAGGVATANIARLRGSTWSAVGGGVNGFVNALCAVRDGDVIAGGDFGTAGGELSAAVARLTTTCPGASVAYGQGCSGTAGPQVLSTTTPPFLGGRFRSTTTGMAANSFAIWFLGVSPLSVPLPPLLPQSGVACDLLATLDVASFLLLPVGGVATGEITWSADPYFLGLALYHQVAQVEFDAQLAISLITTSNGLQLTLGAF